MTLVRTVDENGDEILVCEPNDDGEYVWNPTPREFSAYKARDAELARHNVMMAHVLEAVSGNVSRVDTAEIGVPCDGYRYTRGTLEPYYSPDTRQAISEKGHYFRLGVRRGGASPDMCIHLLSTWAASKPYGF